MSQNTRKKGNEREAFLQCCFINLSNKNINRLPLLLDCLRALNTFLLVTPVTSYSIEFFMLNLLLATLCLKLKFMFLLDSSSGLKYEIWRMNSLVVKTYRFLNYLNLVSKKEFKISTLTLRDRSPPRQWHRNLMSSDHFFVVKCEQSHS